MNRWAGKVAVVTGASAGIGLSIAEAFVREGLTVVGLARRKDKMEERMEGVKGAGKFYARECDVTKSEDVDSAFAWIKNTLDTVNILINNAGVAASGSIEDTKIEDMQFVINVNLMGVLYCTKQAINLIKENGQEGFIVNINSIAGHRILRTVGRNSNVYSATKFALRSLSETLTHELMGSKIRVSNISPGVVKTEIIEKMGGDPSIYEHMPHLNPEDIANSVMHVVGAPFHVQIRELTIQPTGELL